MQKNEEIVGIAGHQGAAWWEENMQIQVLNSPSVAEYFCAVHKLPNHILTAFWSLTWSHNFAKGTISITISLFLFL